MLATITYCGDDGPGVTRARGAAPREALRATGSPCLVGVVAVAGDGVRRDRGLDRGEVVGGEPEVEGGEGGEGLDEALVLLEVLAAKAGQVGAKVARALRERAGEQAAAER